VFGGEVVEPEGEERTVTKMDRTIALLIEDVDFGLGQKENMGEYPSPSCFSGWSIYG
jgi:hypothetical protein